MSYHTASKFIEKMGYNQITLESQINENHTPDDARDILMVLRENPDTITAETYFGDKKITKEEFAKEWTDHVRQLMRISYAPKWMDRVTEIANEVRDQAYEEFDIKFANEKAKEKKLDLFEVYLYNDKDITEGVYEGRKAGEVSGYNIKWLLGTDKGIKSYPFFDCVITKNDDGMGRRQSAEVWK